MAKRPQESPVGAVHDSLYDLVSVLYHALKGAELYAAFIDDAEGDDELVSFFKEAKAESERRAGRAKMLLANRVSTGQRAASSPATDLENAAE